MIAVATLTRAASSRGNVSFSHNARALPYFRSDKRSPAVDPCDTWLSCPPMPLMIAMLPLPVNLECACKPATAVQRLSKEDWQPPSQPRRRENRHLLVSNLGPSRRGSRRSLCGGKE